VDIWLARHGETEWSKSGQHTGSTDLPLTPNGEEQARQLGTLLRGHRFEQVLTSPLTRAQETARSAGFGDRAQVSGLLREFDYGDYEGMTTKDIQLRRPGWELFRDGCPNGEAPEQVAVRMDELIGRLHADNPGDADILIFGHGHALRALATRYLHLAIAEAGVLRLDAGSLSILGHEHGHRALSLWNRPP
jgi:broad specificity phosphatase PhoE